MAIEEKHIGLFNPGGCLTSKAIELFIDGKLTGEDQNQVLAHAQECELCSDAIEGAKMFTSSQEFAANVQKLQESAWRRSLSQSGKSRRLMVGISSIAASVIVLAGLFYLMQIRKDVAQKGKASENAEIAVIKPEEKKPEAATVLPKDEVQSEAKPTKEFKKQETKTKFATPVVVEENNFKAATLIEADSDIQSEAKPELKSDYTEPLTRKSLSQEDKMAEEENSQPVTSSGYFTNRSEVASGKSSEMALRKRSISLSDDSKSEQFSEVSETWPMFRGGDIETFKKYLVDTLKILMPDLQISDDFILHFRVTDKGIIEKVRLVKETPSTQLNKIIVQVTENSKGWTPAYRNGKPVSIDEEVEIKQSK
jgi:hypothetical protein